MMDYVCKIPLKDFFQVYANIINSKTTFLFEKIKLMVV